MIKGNLKDVSLPGLLQFLASEADRHYRIQLDTGSQHGEVVISDGRLISARFGLLHGEDALCELFNWDLGIFAVESIALAHTSTVAKNLDLSLKPGITFACQSSFLKQSNLGLNTTIQSSKRFGTNEWQETFRAQPLEREDFMILGWLSGGKSMRQALREFGIDLVQATAILYRLALTNSVEVVTRLKVDETEPGEPTYPGPVSRTAAPSPHKTPLNEPASPVSATSKTPPETAPSAEGTDSRTTILPICSLDIDRLMNATFDLTEFGFLALKNPALDKNIRQVLLEAKESKGIGLVVAELDLPPSAVLATFRYCLERGYIRNPDPVLPLTADLLLSRTELDQYLLQRRRLTGEEIRYLLEASRTAKVGLNQMLMRAGYISREDLENVMKQQARFALKA